MNSARRFRRYVGGRLINRCSDSRKREPSIRAVGPRKPWAIVAGIQTQLVTRAVGLGARPELASILYVPRAYIRRACARTRAIVCNAGAPIHVRAIVTTQSFSNSRQRILCLPPPLYGASTFQRCYRVPLSTLLISSQLNNTPPVRRER